MMVDSLDIAIWSVAPYPHNGLFTLAALIGVPLALDAGVRRHWVGVVFPFVALSLTVVARVAAGRSADAPLLVWLVIGLGWGLLLSRYCERLEERSDNESALVEAAQQRRAFIAGQNSMAMGADSVIDGIEGILPVLGPPQQGSVLWQVADAWKSKLAELTRSDAAYLGQVLAGWSARHNAHPDLSSRVEFQLPEGIGTLLLTGDQETALIAMLDGLELRGVVPVCLDDLHAQSRLPGSSLGLRVGDHRVEVPADPNRLARPYDPGPAAFVIVTVLMLTDMVLARVNPTATGAAIVLALAAAWWTHRQLYRRGQEARGVVIVVAVIVGVTYAGLAAWQLGLVVNPAGAVSYPLVPSLDLLGLLGGYYWDHLSRGSHLFFVAGVTCVLAASWVLHPAPQSMRDLLLATLWSVPLGLSAWRFSRELDKGAFRHQELVNVRQVDAMATAFDEGRVAVVELVRAAAGEARQRLSEVADSLSPRLAAVTAAKLNDVYEHLRAMLPEPGHGSSTATG